MLKTQPISMMIFVLKLVSANHKAFAQPCPYQNKTSKNKRLSEWFSPKITHMQRIRDESKRQKQWSDFKRDRNKARL